MLTIGDIRDDLFRLAGVEDTSAATNAAYTAILKDITTAINTGLQNVWIKRGPDMFNREVLQIVLSSGQASYQIEDSQTIDTPFMLGSNGLLNLTSYSQYAAYMAAHRDARPTGDVEAAFLEYRKTDDNETPVFILHVAPVPTATRTVETRHIKRIVGYTLAQVQAGTLIPHVAFQYHETFLLPYCRKAFTKSKYFNGNKSEIAAEVADAAATAQPTTISPAGTTAGAD
ncbi:MAG: hypothetical protein LBT53_04480 [Puniceicoccales bacterium]|jgi:hypothetical protein|nr:hypothetical protein [Puniceicoccales bacterium]